VKAYNISDVETPALQQRGLVNAHIRVGDRVLAPGTMHEIHPRYRAMIVQRFQGAIALDALPPGYRGRACPQPTIKSEPPEESE